MGVKTTCIEAQKAKNRMSKKRIEERTTVPLGWWGVRSFCLTFLATVPAHNIYYKYTNLGDRYAGKEENREKDL
jgi:hypothetical protein